MPTRAIEGGISVQSSDQPSCYQKISNIAARIGNAVAAPFIAFYHWICPINPVTQAREFRLIPTCVEKFIGKVAYHPLIGSSGGAIPENDPENGHYASLLRKIGEKLAAKSPRKGLSFEFTLIDSNKDNAWCLPGGKIGFNIGLIKHMEKETNDYGLGFHPTLEEKIGAVLSHEITHATARHGGRSLEFSFFLFLIIHSIKYALSYFVRRRYDKEIEMHQNDPAKQFALMRERDRAVGNFFSLLNPLSKLAISGLTLCKGRKHELEADKYGMHLFANVQEPGLFTKASPRAAIWLMHFFKEHHPPETNIGWLERIKEFFSTHPTPEERLKANVATWQTLQQKV